MRQVCSKCDWKTSSPAIPPSLEIHTPEPTNLPLTLLRLSWLPRIGENNLWSMSWPFFLFWQKNDVSDRLYPTWFCSIGVSDTRQKDLDFFWPSVVGDKNNQVKETETHFIAWKSENKGKIEATTIRWGREGGNNKISHSYSHVTIIINMKSPVHQNEGVK